MALAKLFGNYHSKITILVVLSVFIFQNKLLCQNTEEKLSVDFENISLKKVIRYVEKKTEYRFFYSENLIKNITGLSYKSSSVTVRELLTVFLVNSGLTFQIDNHLIVIKRRVRKKELYSLATSKRLSVIRGIVSDENRETLPGVNIFLKGVHRSGVTTNNKGEYSIHARLNDTICFSFLGFNRKEIIVSDTLKSYNIYLKGTIESLDEAVVVGYGKQRAVSVVGSITSLDMKSVSLPVTPISNLLAGRMSGLIGVQYSGEPGSNFSNFWIRGVSTFGANRDALILIDGIERDNLNDLVPSDIEHLSILKDATATAIYGAIGGNGVVLITTKRGRKGKLKINFKTSLSLETINKLPEYLDAIDYSILANEARAVREEAPVYSERDMKIISNNLDTDLLPNVDWQKETLNNHSLASLSTINMSGGDEMLRYYISGNVKTNEALYKIENDNMKRTLYGFRSNLDLEARDNLKITLDISVEHWQMNKPGDSISEQIWQNITEATPLIAPVRYSNGTFPTYGRDNKMVPTTLLNETGYKSESSTALFSRLVAVLDCSSILKGMSLDGTLSYDNRHNSVEKRIKSPALYRMVGYSFNSGDQIYEKRTEAKPNTYSSSDFTHKLVYLEGKINYNRIWKNAHRLDAILLYNQRNYMIMNEEEIHSMPYRNQGVAGRVAYSYNDIYLTEFNFGYTGSENFSKEDRFGFFPSIALGWVLSNYESWHHKLPFLTLFKLRASFGLVGNDEILDKRFPHMTLLDLDADGFIFGNHGKYIQTGIAEQEVGSENVKWEVAQKTNLGVDINVQNRFELTFDMYQDYRKGIFMRRESLPDFVGVNPKPYGNWGDMRNWGFDGNLSVPISRGEFICELETNVTYTFDEIKKYEEQVLDYSYQESAGQWNMVSRGLIALGLFEDEEDIRNSPQQFGKVLAGDIKYKDVNSDGKIDDDDIVPIGHGSVPKLQYGIALNMYWKNFYARLFFRGSGKVNFFYGGSGFFPFANRDVGNVLSVVNESDNRWIPSTYSGRTDTENPNALFPRLTYGDNINNNRASTFWFVDGSYLKIKNIEIGYSFPEVLLKKIYLSSCRISLIADNVATFSKVTLWDPEQLSSNGAVYPIPRSYTLSLSVGF